MSLQTIGAGLPDEVAALGPWFHNLHLPDGAQTAPATRIPNTRDIIIVLPRITALLFVSTQTHRVVAAAGSRPTNVSSSPVSVPRRLRVFDRPPRVHHVFTHD